MTRVLWVVEVLDPRGRWATAPGVDLRVNKRTRSEGRALLREWRQRFPYWRFRLRKYTPEDKGGEQ